MSEAMTGFKETEIGLIPEDWEVKKLGEALSLNYGKNLPVKMRKDGIIPVFGSNGVVGFHNSCIVEGKGIIVGRKGTAGKIHFSKEAFYPIDTTFFISEKDTSINLIFLFYCLTHLNLKRIVGDVGVPGLNKEMAYLEKMKFPKRESEQKAIAKTLSTIQQAIQTQQALIERTTELKKAMMNKLFTEGTRGEKQKKTEIGLVPESWEVVEIGSICNVSAGGTPSRKKTEK